MTASQARIDRATPNDLMELASDVGRVPMNIGGLLVLHPGPGFDVTAAVTTLGERARLDDGAARLEQPVALGGIDHAYGDAVLHRAAGVEVLHLGQHRGRDALGDLRQTDQWGVADEVDHRVVVLHEAQA